MHPAMPEAAPVGRFQSLSAGQYWRALVAIEDRDIEAGEMLLIQSIRWVDDKPHTIILRAHPDKIGRPYRDADGKPTQSTFVVREHRFLLADFLSRFEFEVEPRRVRDAELAVVQGKVAELQHELVEAQSRPEVLGEVVRAALASKAGSGNGLPAAIDREAAVRLATGSVSEAMGSALLPADVDSMKAAAEREHKVATIKAEWIQGKTQQIASTLSAMTPYFEEQAAAALAQTEDVRSYTAKLMDGIASLGLYVGTEVSVTTICEGEDAPADEPLSFVQQKLIMEEELAVWADVDESFDFTRQEVFFAALREHAELVEQIFPSPRCVLVMAARRRDLDYGNSFTNVALNEINHRVFLLVRNGQNIHKVVSPVTTHLRASRLFPSRDEHDAIFRGFDGSRIKFEDVAYTDKLAAHEASALHYKRFLLLVCGLDHRLGLFGKFYEGPPSLDFVSMSFQERYCRFIHDDDGQGMLPRREIEPLSDWMARKNAYLRSGSRVACLWLSAINPDTAPHVCEDKGSKVARKAFPRRPFDVVVARRVGEDIVAKAEVSIRGRTSLCKVALSRFEPNYWPGPSYGFLCLDAVRPEELRERILSRRERTSHLDYLKLFKLALRHLEREREAERDMRKRLHDALIQARLANDSADAQRLVDETVQAWRAANHGAALPAFDGDKPPKAWRALLDQMFVLAGGNGKQAEEVAALVRSMGMEPLRLVSTGGLKMSVYAAIPESQQDNRIEDFVWVCAIKLKSRRGVVVEDGRSWALLPEAVASETTLHQWPAAEIWQGRKSAFFKSPEHKAQVFDSVKWKPASVAAVRHVAPERFDDLMWEWAAARIERNRSSDMVVDLDLVIPFGLVRVHGVLRALCAGFPHAHALLHKMAPSEAARQALREQYVRMFANRQTGGERFDGAASSPYRWRLLLCDMTELNGRSPSGFVGRSSPAGSSGPAISPLISDALEAWQLDQEKGAKFALWLDPAVVGRDGRATIDEACGLRLPDDYEPVLLSLVTLNRTASQSGMRKWIDVEPLSENHSGKVDFDRVRAVAGNEYSCSASSFSVFSRSEATAAIRRLLGDEAILVNGLDLPQPPEGVERWAKVVPK